MENTPSIPAQVKTLSRLHSHSTPPKILLNTITEIASTLSNSSSSLNKRRTIQPGDPLPNFTVPDMTNTPVQINTLVGHGSPVLLTFHHGGWCPFDSLVLASLHSHLDEFDARGAAIVGLSPEPPAHLAKTAQHRRVYFPLLSDTGNRVAQSLGLACPLRIKRHALSAGFESWVGVELGLWNGDHQDDEIVELVLSVPSTLLVDGRGIVRKMDLMAGSPDFRRRMDTMSFWPRRRRRRRMEKAIGRGCVVNERKRSRLSCWRWNVNGARGEAKPDGLF
ncbi:Thioredoxin-like fold [Rhypophila sp. PSN 637]